MCTTSEGAGLRRVAVVGNGTLAVEFACAAADAGWTVAVRATDATTPGMPEGVEVHDSPGGAGSVDLVIEAVADDATAKAEALSEIASWIGHHAVVATTTATLSVTALAAASGIPPERVGGLHRPDIPGPRRIVEIVAAELTSPATVDALTAFIVAIDLVPVPVRDRPGFLVDRLVRPYLNQALRAYDEGIASREDIDIAVRLGLGYPKGPLETLDEVGLDRHLEVTRAIHAQLHHGDFAPPPVLTRLVEAGWTGHRVGRGIAEHGQGKA